MTKEKNIQIPESLFVELCKYFLFDVEMDTANIEKQLSDKINSIVRRELFTKYRIAQTQEEKEQAWKNYIDNFLSHN